EAHEIEAMLEHDDAAGLTHEVEGEMHIVPDRHPAEGVAAQAASSGDSSEKSSKRSSKKSSKKSSKRVKSGKKSKKVKAVQQSQKVKDVQTKAVGGNPGTVFRPNGGQIIVGKQRRLRGQQDPFKWYTSQGKDRIREPYGVPEEYLLAGDVFVHSLGEDSQGRDTIQAWVWHGHNWEVVKHLDIPHPTLGDLILSFNNGIIPTLFLVGTRRDTQQSLYSGAEAKDWIE
ncbi:hypothetical protein K474DRAFT_1680871, partial [Panus rudis PR-1116 ss-1]